MQTAVTNRRSLTFYQHTSFSPQSVLAVSHAGGVTSVVVANITMNTIGVTTGYKTQLQGFLREFNQLRADDAARLDLTKPNANARNVGVRRAWQYEQADIKMGGKGSAEWPKYDRDEILETGKVRQKPVVDGNGEAVLNENGNPKMDGPEGHHIENVKNHPDNQANPDNIRFFKNKEAHLRDGHGGNFQNETDGELIDKNKMLEKTNSRRVFRNELQGLGAAIALGAGIGMTIGFIITLAQAGVSPESLRLAAVQSAKIGLEAGILSAASYGIGRTLGEIATEAAIGLLGKIGVTVIENISKMVGMGVYGGLTILIISAYQFARLKLRGVPMREALLRTGNQALFSLSILAVSIAAQGIWGGAAGLIVSISIGLIFITYQVSDAIHQRHFAEKVRVYMIEKSRPVFAF